MIERKKKVVTLISNRPNKLLSGSVTSVVYSPNKVDAQRDWASPESIKIAAHYYLKNARILDTDHKQPAKAKLVESYIAQGDWEIGKKLVKKGSWIIVVHVMDKELWNKIQNGDYTGFSMGFEWGISDNNASASQ